MANGHLTPYRRSSLASGGAVGGFGGGSLFDLHRQMNRLFDNLLEGGGLQSFGGGTGTTWPQLEIEQQDDQLQVRAELPGVSQDDIDLTIEEGVLTLSGEKRSERKDENGYSERSYGRFERHISLPRDVDEDGCSAYFKEGLLTVTCPRREEKRRGRRIPLGGGDQSEDQSVGRAEAQNDTASSYQQAAQESGSGGQQEGQQS